MQIFNKKRWDKIKKYKIQVLVKTLVDQNRAEHGL